MTEPSPEILLFADKTERAFRSLFEAARVKHELDFVLSLCPEFRGCQDAGWCTWEETKQAFDEYVGFLNEGPMTTFKMRVALSFYSHLSEASGFYECPKNLLRVAGGQPYRMWPFLELNKKHKVSGNVIAPNANKVLRDLIADAHELGLSELVEVLKDAFDSDIRNGYAHADYIIWADGLRLRRQAGGRPRVVSWDEFDQALNRAVIFFSSLRQMINEYLSAYKTPRVIHASMGGAPASDWTIRIDEISGQLTISG